MSSARVKRFRALLHPLLSALCGLLLGGVPGCGREVQIAGGDDDPPPFAHPLPALLSSTSPDSQPAAQPAPTPMIEEGAARPEVLWIRFKTEDSWNRYAMWAGLSQRELRNRAIRENRRHGLVSGQRVGFRLSPDERARFERLRDAHYRQLEEDFFRWHEIESFCEYVVKPLQRLESIASCMGPLPTWLLERVNVNRDLLSLSDGSVILLPLLRNAAPAEGRALEARQRKLSELRRQSMGDHQRPSDLAICRGDVCSSRGLSVEKGHGRLGVGDNTRPTLNVRSSAGAIKGNWFTGGPGRSQPVARPVAGSRGGGVTGGGGAADERGRDVGASSKAEFSQRIVVRPGEALSFYAAWADTTVPAIVAANEITDPASIAVGRNLVIPMSESRVMDFLEARKAFRRQRENRSSDQRGGRDDGPRIHEVRPGESAWLIATKNYGIELNDLRAANPGVDLGSLVPGQRLRIPY